METWKEFILFGWVFLLFNVAFNLVFDCVSPLSTGCGLFSIWCFLTGLFLTLGGE